jgi:hypothetical protein
LRRAIAATGLAAVQQFDAPVVAGQFLNELERLVRAGSSEPVAPSALL